MWQLDVLVLVYIEVYDYREYNMIAILESNQHKQHILHYFLDDGFEGLGLLRTSADRRIVGYNFDLD